MAGKDLVKLIDLSLGVEPQGVVNLNYLHGLLHEIVKRLVDIESIEFPIPAYKATISRGQASKPELKLIRPSIDQSVEKKDKGMSVTSMDQTGEKDKVASMDQTGEKGKSTASMDQTGEKGKSAASMDQTGEKGKSAASMDQPDEKDKGKSAASMDQMDEKDKGKSVAFETKKEKTMSTETEEGKSVTGKKEEKKEIEEKQVESGEISKDSSGSTAKPFVVDENSMVSLRTIISDSKSRISVASAANDLGVLEKKMQELEMRVNTMETLPDLIERISADSGATPVSDMWNFTNLNNRLNAVEEGLGKNSKLVDDLMGEFRDLRSKVLKQSETGDHLLDKISELDSIKDRLNDLEGLKLAAAQGDTNTTLLEKLKDSIKAVKDQVDDIDLSQFVTTSSLDDTLSKALQEQKDMLAKHEELLQAQNESLTKLEKSLSESMDSAQKLDERTEDMKEKLQNLLESVGKMEADLESKVNASDLASLMPKADDEAATLMPKVLEIQSKLNLLESQLGAVPPDVLDQISAMKDSISTLTKELSSLSALVKSKTGGSDRLDDLGSQLAQLRERLNDIDRAMSALTEHISSYKGSAVAEEPDGAKFVDLDTFNAVQACLAQLQQENERLLGTAAQLSYELDINKEHVKTLYNGVEDLKDSKADRTKVEVEVREKADRRALENKASREWVDSTFERLDREIREAKSKMLGQEEAFKSAVDQLNEDVEGKLDRMELQTLKDYFDKKLDRVKSAPKVVVQESLASEAAGFKKSLHFHCISCDKPLAIKPFCPIPALPSITTFPGSRSFRPYTTYELELIRKHQKLGYPIPVDSSRSSCRSAGGSHTMTRPHQRIRLSPFGNVPHSQEIYSNPVSKSSPLIMNEEMDIIGHDGHIYKGRSNRSRLPPMGKYKRNRPGTTPNPTF